MVGGHAAGVGGTGARRPERLRGKGPGQLGPRTVQVGGQQHRGLSRRRAEAVRAVLGQAIGAPSDQAEPVAPNDNDDGSDYPEGRALGRRVEITYPAG